MRFNRMNRVFTLLCVLATAALLSSCGGGGGGGTASTTPAATNNTTPAATGRTITVSGTFSSTSASRAAGRAVSAAIPNTPVVAFILGDTNRTPINGATDATDANGNFSITLDLGTASSANVIIEAVSAGSTLGSAANIRMPLEGISANLSGVSADNTTAAEGLLWIYNPGQSLANKVRPAVAFFASENIDIRSGLDASAAQALMTAMASVVDTCGAMQEGDAKKSCVVNKLNELTISNTTAAALTQKLELGYKVDAGTASTKEMLMYYAPAQSEATIDAVIAMANTAGASLSGVDSSAKATELFSKLEQALLAYNASAASDLAKKVNIKNYILISLNTETFTSSAIQDVLIQMKAGYEGVIAYEAAAMTSLVDSTRMTSALAGYDNTLGMFLNVFSQKASVNQFQSWAMVYGLLYCLDKLGETSEGTSTMGAALDNWVAAYDDATFRTQLHTLLDPLGMSDRAKTQDLMRLAHDLNNNGGTRAQIESTLGQYLTAATTAKAMALYDKYAGNLSCNNLTLPINFNNLGSNCPTQDEIVDLLETHFEKSLPVLDAVMTGVQDYINNNTTKFAGLTSLNDIYTDMKASTSNKASIGPAVDAAGMDKELFWLVMNMEPYL